MPYPINFLIPKKKYAGEPILARNADGEIVDYDYKDIFNYNWQDRVYRHNVATRWTGYNISGLESGSQATTGNPGINYPKQHDRKYVQWLKDNGVKTVRLPFLIERLMPVPGKPVETEYANIIKQFCGYCQEYGVEVFLDCHNYGSYFYTPYGGITGNLSNTANVPYYFDNRYNRTNGTIEIRNPTNTSAISCFEIVMGGNPYNPLPPATGYKFSTNFKITSTQGDIWNSVLVCAMYRNDLNHYYIEVGPNINIKLHKVINGVDTIIGSFINTYTTGTNINITIDVNQASLGNVVVGVNGTTNAITAPHDPLLNRGKVGYKTSGVNADINSFSLNIAGDTTSAGNGGDFVAWGNTGAGFTYDTTFHELVYTNLFKEFDNLPAVVGYMYNEPHDLAVPTTPSNYLTTATATVFQQAALNKLRQLGSEKWFGWTTDNWGGVQNVAVSTSSPVRWGASFNLPWNDPLEKTFLDFHYYPDNYTSSIFVNSGTYGSLDGATPFPYTNAQITTQIGSVLSRLKTINDARILNNKLPVPFCLSETGIPNTAPWLGVLDFILDLLTSYNAGFMYFGIGEFFGNDYNNIAADPNVYSNINGTKVINLINYQARHAVVNKYLNKEIINLR